MEIKQVAFVYLGMCVCVCVHITTIKDKGGYAFERVQGAYIWGVGLRKGKGEMV